jgi:mycofactocin precursor
LCEPSHAIDERLAMTHIEPTEQTDQIEDALVAEDLIEEVSIDGMCGVY